MDKEIVSWFHCFMILKQRKPNRLKNFDYSDNGWYFVTICTEDRQEYFGNIANNKINFNEYGKIINNCWVEIPQHFNNVKLDEYQIMPNHVHGIVIIVGAGLSRPILGQIIGYFKYQSTKYINDFVMKGSDNPTPTENKIKQIFQRSFYDYIIRNEFSLNRIRHYIKDNPKNWDEDRNNLKIRNSELSNKII